MSDIFVDNVTPLNAETLNQFEEYLKQYAKDQAAIPASQNTFGSVKIWVEGTTLNISTNLN